MDVPFRLARRDHSADADALFVPGRSAADLLGVLAAVGGRWPDVFRLSGGFLVVPGEPTTQSIPRTVRLRRIAGDLFVPADADLLPALRPDEAVGLTQHRGLVFLPGGPPLAFDPDATLPESALLRCPAVRGGAWEPLPTPPALADRLHVIRAEMPPSAVVEILTSGRPDDADPLGQGPGSDAPVPEDARPPAGSAAGRVAAGARFAAGRVLNFLGRTLGIGSLARAGANLARRAIEQVPRLSEKVLGDQEAALRELLRQFQAGDVERALRRAPIAVPDPDAPPAQVGSGSRLTDHDTRYSLRGLLTSGGGGGVAWLGGGDVWAQLAAEYRRLAEEATRRGDYRRAAYLYGVLLRDPRQAAHVLDAGGLHRDAAVLYRDKLHDKLAAAGCFERSGMWDEAVELYQQLDQFEKAAEVFRRIGDEESALDMYGRAADRLEGRGQYVAAGDLIRDKAGLPERAAAVYQRGWEAVGADALACGQRLLDYRVYVEDWPAVLDLVGAAEERFAPPATAAAGTFFAVVVRHTEHVMPDDLRAELRDRARLALAEHLRQHARINRLPGQVVSTVFGSPGVWPAPVVRDAAVALKHALRPEPAKPAAVGGAFRLLPGPVAAAVVARDTFDLVVANSGRAAVVYRGDDGVQFVAPSGAPLQPLALAVDGSARQVVVMSAGGGVWLETFVAWAGGGYESRQSFRVASDEEGQPYLQPEIDRDGLVRVHGLTADRVLSGPAMLPVLTVARGGEPAAYHFSVPAPRGRWWWRDDVIGLDEWTASDHTITAPARTVATVFVAWRPATPPGSALAVPSVDWLRPRPDALELVGVTALEAVRWNEVQRDGDALRLESATGLCPVGFRVACLIGPGLVAAVDGTNAVHWLKVDGGRLRAAFPPRRLDALATPTFIAHRPQAHEVVVVFTDGTAVRVPKP